MAQPDTDDATQPRDPDRLGLSICDYAFTDSQAMSEAVIEGDGT